MERKDKFLLEMMIISNCTYFKINQSNKIAPNAHVLWFFNDTEKLLVLAIEQQRRGTHLLATGTSNMNL